MNKRLYVCNVYFRSASLPRLNHFITFAVAGGEDDIRQQILAQLQANVLDESIDLIEVSWVPVKREVIEWAATKVLGWQPPAPAAQPAQRRGRKTA